MNSKDYWAKREEEQRRKNITDEKEYAKKIQEIYSYTMDQVQKEINGFYTKYAKAEGITMAEAKKRVSQLDIEEYSRKAKKYVKEKNFSKKANEEMRLYNATMKINRLEMLKANIGLEMVSSFDELQKFFGEKLTDQTLKEFERQAGILGETITNNGKMANSIVNASFHNATFSDRIWMYQGQLKAELSKLLQEGLIQGKHPRELARHIRKLFGSSRVNAERLLITEMARVRSDAQKQSFERNGFEDYEFIAEPSACPICAALNGKHFKVAKMMPGENAAPMHPYCRCSVAAWEDGDDYEAWLDFLDKGGTTEEWEKRKIYTKRLKQEKISYQDSFGKKLDKQISQNKSYRQLLKTKYHQGTNIAKKVMRKYLSEDAIAETHFMGIPHFSVKENKLYLNIERDSSDGYRGNGAQFFHEIGHYIDYNAGNISQNKEFSKLLNDDFSNYLANIERKNNVNKKIAEQILEEELMQDGATFKYKHGVSDIIDGITKGRVVGSGSHSTNNPFYWENKGNIEREAFAHMYESCYNKEKAKAMSEYFPNAYKKFKKDLKKAVE